MGDASFRKLPPALSIAPHLIDSIGKIVTLYIHLKNTV